MATRLGALTHLKRHPEHINLPYWIWRRENILNLTSDPGVTTQDRQYNYLVFYGAAQVSMIVVATLLVIFCALLTGLTLAVCGLDMDYLQLRSRGKISATQTQDSANPLRRHAKEVLRMKRYSTWMLCSLVLVAVACSQTFPFVIQSVWHGPQLWVPLLISTLTMAIFVEILPQYIIPKRAITWGFYCWPIIWGCMLATSPVSFPIAWLLNRFHTKKERHGIFKNDELAVIIQHHEESAKKGGKLGQDAARIMLGALKLESQRLGADSSADSDQKHNEKDVEKADASVSPGMIVKWEAVKTISIDDFVDEEFIKKIKTWSYSRIPVIGPLPTTDGAGATADICSCHPSDFPTQDHNSQDPWEGGQLFGFLHIKYLIGLDTRSRGWVKSENKLTVRDLPLYPIPIVRDDMSVYELLNLFQLGMSRQAAKEVLPNYPESDVHRIAVVVHDPQDAAVVDSTVKTNGHHRPTVWTATERTNTRLMSNLKGGKGRDHWTMDYLKAAQAAAECSDKTSQNVLGIRCPRPLGIVTFEDIVDTILQKTSRDESDFFDRDTSTPPTKSKKPGDYRHEISAIGSSPSPHLSKKAHVTFDESVNPGTLRQRKVSNTIRSHGGFDGANDGIGEYVSSIKLPKRRKSEESSYTINNDGGFHGPDESCNSLDRNMFLTAEEIIKLANTSSSASPGNPYSHGKAASLPTRRSESPLSEHAKKDLRIVSAASRIPMSTLRRVGPFSRGHSSKSEKDTAIQAPQQHQEEGKEMNDLSALKMPILSASARPFPASGLAYNPKISGIDNEGMHDTFKSADLGGHAPEKSGETVSLLSCSSDDEVHQKRCVYDALPVPGCEKRGISSTHDSLNASTKEKESTEPYAGFPVELLEDTSKENRVPKFSSKTLPRNVGIEFDLGALSQIHNANDPRARESSFHDDRALLPSQRRLLDHSSTGLGTRSSSLWF
ncbi:hypothetical protein BUE80_DR011536 [Diplocarpon rosae]|nr:hypothetical protein BUE80_DR011536 [Diplocarpon rosae]